jgi:hypothetical protein
MRRCELVQFPFTDTAGKPVVGWICGSTPSAKQLPACEFCLAEYSRQERWAPHVKDGARQCDHPVGGRDDRGLAKTCDRYICLEHATRQGQFDWCPEHREAHV